MVEHYLNKFGCLYSTTIFVQTNSIMATKKKAHNTDAKEVASLQSHELKYICRIFSDKFGKLPMGVLKNIMRNLGEKGKMCRSRRKIYIGLKALGYSINLKK